MLRTLYKTVSLTVLMVVIPLLAIKAQNITPDYNDHDYDRVKIDRYLDVEIWPNHSDGDYYEGDNIVINFRSNKDAFVTIYTVDSRGRVNLLFPTGPGMENYIEGGVTYHLPGGGDDFDLVVNGPEGVENIQIIASRERFPIPDWYPTSGLIFDGDDRFEYMDYINNRFFVRYNGQRFAFDRTSIYINEWEEYYYRPIYDPYYPSWTLYGNLYIDYPYGGTVYINGIYWGCIPLYIPRIYVGWHTFTIYDYYGYCWESDFYVTRYNTIVLNRTIVRTSPRVVSKYKEIRHVGYRDPVKNGYPKFKTKNIVKSSSSSHSKTTVGKSTTAPVSKKYVRGSTKVVKTERGYETAGKVYSGNKKGKTIKKSSKTYHMEKSEGSYSKGKSGSSTSFDYNTKGYSGKSYKKERKSEMRKSKSGEKSSKSSGYYQKKSGKKSSYKKSSKSYKSRKPGSSGKKGSNFKRGSSKPHSSGSTKSSKSGKSYSGGKSSGGKSSGKVSSPSGKSSSGKSSNSGKKSPGSKRKR